MTKAVCALIKLDNNLVLSVSLKDDHTNFRLPGGKLEDGESYEDALHREVLEETGYKIKIASDKYYTGMDGEWVARTYLCEIVSHHPECIEEGSGVVVPNTRDALKVGSFGNYNKKLFRMEKQLW
jgi:ADP-ribose pyrophosphatase YjhB (NUDIX family)